MRILLLGEFSSLHKFLKEGLLELGVEVDLAANGDGWKKISGADFSLYDSSENNLKQLYNMYIQSMIKASQFKGYDVVQVIKPFLYPKRINTQLLQMIKRNNGVFSVVAAGTDYALYSSYSNGCFDYYLYDYDKQARNKYCDQKRINTEKKIISSADIIIPSLYEYSLGYTNNINSVIPFPINYKNIVYSDNEVHGKVVFFHGINRELAKGTPFIKEALSRLKNKYPNDVEVIIDGHLPYEQYLDVMSRTNVVVDQCCTYGYGINACLAMAQGKIVMTPCRKETLQAFGWDESPIIHIEPNVGMIYDQLVQVLENRSNLVEIGSQSRLYVEQHHDYIKIAEKYIQAWKSVKK